MYDERSGFPLAHTNTNECFSTHDFVCEHRHVHVRYGLKISLYASLSGPTLKGAVPKG